MHMRISVHGCGHPHVPSVPLNSAQAVYQLWCQHFESTIGVNIRCMSDTVSDSGEDAHSSDYPVTRSTISWAASSRGFGTDVIDSRLP